MTDPEQREESRLQVLARHEESQRKFIRRHFATMFLQWWAENVGKENAILFHHLAKRVAQNQAEVDVEEIYLGCKRLTVIYKGNTHSWRIPAPE